MLRVCHIVCVAWGGRQPHFLVFSFLSEPDSSGSSRQALGTSPRRYYGCSSPWSLRDSKCCFPFPPQCQTASAPWTMQAYVVQVLAVAGYTNAPGAGRDSHIGRALVSVTRLHVLSSVRCDPCAVWAAGSERQSDWLSVELCQCPAAEAAWRLPESDVWCKSRTRPMHMPPNTASQCYRV